MEIKRNEKGLTQEKLAHLCDCTKNHIQNIEHKTTIPNVILGLQISKILDFNPFEMWLPDKTND